MKPAVVYVHPIQMSEGYDPNVEGISGTYDACADRFIRTYKNFPAQWDHDLVVVFTGTWPSPQQLAIYEDVAITPMLYTGPGWCSGAHQHASNRMSKSVHFAIFSSARTYFVREGWLRRIMEERENHGYGMYGTMASMQRGPHLRTNFYGVDPAVFRNFGMPIESRKDTWEIEHGKQNLSRWHAENRMQSRLVTWDGSYEMADWNKPENTFRKGDQSNLVVRDRHTLIFEGENEGNRDYLTKVTTGEICD